MKVLDSADGMWFGKGITLLEKLVREEQRVFQPFNVAVYVKADVVKNFE